MPATGNPFRFSLRSLRLLRVLCVPLLILIATPAQAAHITDKLLAGLYDKPGGEQPLKLLPSGTPLEVQEKKGDYARVRLGDGTIGWVDLRYITDEKPARAMLLELQAESAKLREELQQAKSELGKGGKSDAGGSKKEIAALKQQLADAQAELERLRAAPAGAPGPSGQEAPNGADALYQERLWQENQTLRERLAKVGEIVGTELPESPPPPRFQFRLWHLLVLSAFLFVGFIGGVIFRNYRMRQRYSGLRF